jgi:small subunit ribosomal protein S20
MPVTKSARKALRVSERRHEENLLKKFVYKKAIKTVKKALEIGAEETATLFSQAQSALDKAAKSKSIHPNKAARLKSRLSKKVAIAAATPAPAVKAKATSTKKAATRKPANKSKK